MAEETMLDWGPRTLTGTSIQRLDGPAKVSGRAKYSYDIRLPGMLIGRILRSPHPHARVVKVDLSRAAKAPGVKAVLDFEKKTVRYGGEEVAAVAAVSAEAAEAALRLIDVEYEILPFAVVEEQAMDPNTPQIHPQGNVVVPERRQRERGDVAGGFAGSDAVVEATYRTAVQIHNSLETHGGVAFWEGDTLNVYASTQAVMGVRNGLARHFEIPESKVHVITDHMGGGFGSKLGWDLECMAAAKLSRSAGAPVKMMLSRKEENLAVGNRPSAVMRIKAGASKDGRLTAFESETYGSGGVGSIGNIPLPYVYRVPNVKTVLKDVHINAGASRAMRAPGHPQAAFAMDQVMDELAEALGMDVLDLLRANDSDQNAIRLQQYDLGAKAIGWERRNKVAGSGDGPVKRGIGVGCGTWGGSGRRGSFAEVVIHPDGSVEAKSGTQDIGTGTKTLIAMVAAEELGIPMTGVTPVVGDSNLPPGRSSGGSTTAPTTAPAVKHAARQAKVKLLERIAPALSVTADLLEVREGRIHAKDGSRSWAWNEATAQLGTAPVAVTHEFDEGFSGGGVAGVHFAEVEVDVETGRIQPIKIVAVNDCGLVVNKLTAESQVNGGVIGGLSFALLEERVMDPQVGLMLNPGLEPYKIAGAMEMPEIVPILMDFPERGVIGIGEPATIPTAGALANAVYNAIGARVRELPMTPDKVLAALGAV